MNVSRLIGFVIGTIGGALVGFTYGITAMYNKTMSGLGLIKGGTPASLEVETLRYVSALMSDSILKVHIFAMVSVVTIITGILIAYSN